MEEQNNELPEPENQEEFDYSALEESFKYAEDSE